MRIAPLVVLAVSLLAVDTWAQRPAAVFDAAWQRAHRGKILVEAPEVYELVNIAIALTPTAIADPNLVYQKSDYYAQVRAWFDRHRGHPAVTAFDAAIRGGTSAYFSLKMNGYAFEFDARGAIVPSRVYDRTGFRGESANTLRPFVPQLQAFASTSAFRTFYRRHAGTYESQAAFFRREAGLAGMKAWLEAHFPTRFDLYRIVFSPLVHANQSTTWFESGGFRELQPHVNYPYPEQLVRWGVPGLSSEGAATFRGNIVFTELNHGYLGPETDRYRDRILQATSQRDYWVDAKFGPQYYRGLGTFNEYMNWGLVSLRLADEGPPSEQPQMIASIERLMPRRGFPRFVEFNQHLLALYRGRRPGERIADLYPRIIQWFERQNAGGGAAGR